MAQATPDRRSGGRLIALAAGPSTLAPPAGDTLRMGGTTYRVDGTAATRLRLRHETVNYFGPLSAARRSPCRVFLAGHDPNMGQLSEPQGAPRVPPDEA